MIVAMAAAALGCASWLGHARAQENGRTAPRRNAIVFVADGLRNGSVNAKDTPALWKVRSEGVYFANSHSLFPTFTTANASAIATGHLLGDTGDFSNTLWVGHAGFDTGNFGLPPSTPVPFIENDQILGDLADHYGGNYLGEETLVSAAGSAGYSTAVVGKLGPVAVQGIDAIRVAQQRFSPNIATIFLDDSTGSATGIPLPPGFADELAAAGLSAEAPTRDNGYGPRAAWNNGNNGGASGLGTRQANLVQQQWFADATTRVILPDFTKDASKPFFVLFWSRDPDGSQHNEGDSQNSTFPGINGETSRLGVQNADRNLRQILDWLDAHPAIETNTDLFVTSDHGFATISRREISRTGRLTASEAAKHNYLDANGNIETPQGTLPSGFLAIDLALGLHLNLFDPDRPALEGASGPYRQLKLGPEIFEHPGAGDGLLGYDVEKADGSDAKAIVAANGGSDLIYVPDKNPQTVKQIVALLATYDYVGGIFVDDRYGPLPGALPMSEIGLVGATAMPRPAIVVAFKVFYTNPGDLQTAVQVADTALQEGQGNHGGFGRDSTFNNMAALGPDFKEKFEDDAPVSNSDIVPTIAHLLGIEMASKGTLKGRVIGEALRRGGSGVTPKIGHAESPDAGGSRTILDFEEAGGEKYFNRACFVRVPAGTAGVCP
jgi:Type I phosphodiesterase / nucleotide pyrophosphatase